MIFDKAFERLLGHEGGYSDNPADPGGITMYGITQRVARLSGYTGDMHALPLEKAKDIARRKYWNTVKADQLPVAVRFDVFDAAYNSGPRRAIEWLQRAVYVEVDGKFGPATLKGVQTYAPGAIAARFNGHRLNFMNDLDTWATFGRGWSQRIAQNLIATEG